MLKKIIQTWLIGILPTLLIVVVQSIGGKYEGENGSAWLWFLANTLPSIALVSYAFFNANLRNSLFISDKRYSVLFWLSVSYVVILLFSLLLQPLSTSSPIDTLKQSMYWLLPFQLLFLVPFSIAIFGNKKGKMSDVLQEEINDIHFDIPETLKKKKFNVFLSYDQTDLPLLEEFNKHLSIFRRNEIINTWYDAEILAGQEFDAVATQKLAEADFILLLISASFINNDQCYERELKTALERHKKGDAFVVPILLRACQWEMTSFADLIVLPINQKPINGDFWNSKDDAFNEVARGLKKIIQQCYDGV